jgi:hypothetical protein
MPSDETIRKVVCHNIYVWNKFSHRLGIPTTYKSELSEIHK